MAEHGFQEDSSPTPKLDGLEEGGFEVAASIDHSETETPEWLADIDCFSAAHDQAVEAFLAAVENPSKDNIDKANEAIAITKKNIELVFDKAFVWDPEAKNIPTGDRHEATEPLMRSVVTVVRATEDLDARLKTLFPLKIARNTRSLEDIKVTVRDIDTADNQEEADKEIATVSRVYAALCVELEEALKTPSVTKAKSSGIPGPIGKKMSDENVKELRGLAVAGIILLGATVLGNVLSRPRK